MNQKKPQRTWIQGHVNWYDPNTGKGSIISDDGIWYRIHEFSEIQNQKQNALKEKVRVEFELARDSVHPIVRNVRKASATVDNDQSSRSRKPSKVRDI